MQEAYTPYLTELRHELVVQGFSAGVLRDSDFEAELEIAPDLSLIFEGERYYGPAFTLYVSLSKKPGDEARKYAIWIFMRIFERSSLRSYGLPTVRNQVRFMAAELATIRSSLPELDQEYRIENQRGLSSSK